jgi:hypothetical protein
MTFSLASQVSTQALDAGHWILNLSEDSSSNDEVTIV